MSKIFTKYFPKVLFVIALLYISRTFFLHFYPDFTNYYYGPKVWFEGHNPYLGDKHLFIPFNYPPPLLWIFLPITVLSFPVAEIFWTGCSLVLLLVTVSLLYRIYAVSFFSAEALYITSSVFLFYFPVKFTLGMGQLNIFILCCVACCIFFFVKQRPLFSGLFLALAICTKLFPILLPLYFLVQKKWKYFFATFIWGIIISFLTLLIVRISLIVYFVSKVIPGFLSGWKGDYYNQALSGFLTRSIPNIVLRSEVRDVLVFVFVGISLWSVLKVKDQTKHILSICLFITVNVLCNGFSWQHHFVWLLIPFICVYFYLRKHHGSPRYYVLLLTSFFLVGFNLKNPQAVPVLLQSHVFFGGLLLWLLTLFLLLRSSKEVEK